MTRKHTPEAVLRTYFHAKDENRPHLMRAAFCEAATLQMRLRTANIQFPAEAHGLEAIAETLVRGFGLKYENVYSFYLARPESDDLQDFSCGWLVGMSDKATGEVRVGCGRYDWVFDRADHAGSGLAKHLSITIDAMEVLPARQFTPVMDWLGKLAYPWTTAGAVVANPPAFEALEPVLRSLAGLSPLDPLV